MNDERAFLIPPQAINFILDDFGLDEDELMELSIYNVGSGPDRNVLRQELESVDGLATSGYEVKAFDFPLFITLAGSIGSLYAGIDVVVRWVASQADKGKDIGLEIRTKKGGVIRVSAENIEEAQALLRQLAQLVALPPSKPSPQSKWKSEPKKRSDKSNKSA